MSWVVYIAKKTAPTEMCFLIADADVDDFVDRWAKEQGENTLRIVSTRPEMWRRGQPLPTTYAKVARTSLDDVLERPDVGKLMPPPDSYLEYASSVNGLWWRDEDECREVDELDPDSKIYVRLVTVSAPWEK